MVTEFYWTTALAALLTPMVAVLASFIAYRQWRLAQEKLKLDLFDRRFLVYEAARGLLAFVLQKGMVTDEELFKFRVATLTSKWLLNDSIAQYLRDLHNKAIDLQTLSFELEGIPVSEVRTEMVQRRAEVKKFFYAQFEALDGMFAPFLKVHH